MVVVYKNLKFDWLGHAGIKIESEDGMNIYLDPWSETFNEKPDDAAIVCVSHDDFDHYDPPAIEAVSNENTVLILHEGINPNELNRKTISLRAGDEVEVKEAKIKGIRAQNNPKGEHTDENGDPFHAQGEGIGYLLEIDGISVYFAGDTDFLEEHEDIETEVAILPIGGHYTMNRHEALKLADTIRPELVLPIHYDTFEQIETDEDAFVKDVKDIGISAETL